MTVRFGPRAPIHNKLRVSTQIHYNSIMTEQKKPQLTTGTIRHLQEYIAGKIKERGFEDESLQERLLLLTEELGELVNACRKISGMNVDQHREIINKVGEEVVDVLNMVFAVGIELGLDIEKEFFEKNEKIDQRVYGRSQVNKSD